MSLVLQSIYRAVIIWGGYSNKYGHGMMALRILMSWIGTTTSLAEKGMQWRLRSWQCNGSTLII
jgi:hypothetical protein